MIVFINTFISLLFWRQIVWVKWLAIIFPTVGGLRLLVTTILKNKGTWIDYIILILDVLVLFLVLKNYIL
mgnify:CR=1 FL=1